MKRQYTTLLFDADETIFDFKKAERTALRQVLSTLSIDADDRVLSRYHEINAGLWHDFEKELITKEDIKNERYKRLFEEFGFSVSVTAREINDRYTALLAEGDFLLPGAEALLRALHAGGYQLYLITNGIARTQLRRLEKSGLAPLFEDVFVSESVGFQKPMLSYFEVVLSRITEKDKRRVLVIGDSLQSDIRGANNAGLDCVWFNPDGKENDWDLSVTKQVRSFKEIAAFLGVKTAENC